MPFRTRFARTWKPAFGSQRTASAKTSFALGMVDLGARWSIGYQGVNAENRLISWVGLGNTACNRWKSGYLGSVDGIHQKHIACYEALYAQYLYSSAFLTNLKLSRCARHFKPCKSIKRRLVFHVSVVGCACESCSNLRQTAAPLLPTLQAWT